MLSYIYNGFETPGKNVSLEYVTNRKHITDEIKYVVIIALIIIIYCFHNRKMPYVMIKLNFFITLLKVRVRLVTFSLIGKTHCNSFKFNFVKNKIVFEN